MAWSYGLLDDEEKALLVRCSVFAGGFDLESACAVPRFEAFDDLAVLDQLDALVRKSLVVADTSAGRTRFSMLETIRQFAEEQLVASDDAEETRAAHARYFGVRAADILVLWDGPRQREAYTWFALELANLRTAFRWAVDRGDLDTAAAIAVYAPMLGCWVEQFEPIGWAEEVIESARAADHRRLAQLYVVAAQGFAAGRVDDAMGYADAARQAIESGQFDQVPYEFETWLGGPYVAIGEPERWIELCRNMIARTPGAHVYARGSLVLALSIAGEDNDAISAAAGLLEAAEASDNPLVVSFACMAYGFAHRDAAASEAYEVLRRGLRIARDSGNKQIETHLAVILARLAGTRGEPVDALDFLALVIRNFYDAGSVAHLFNAMALLAVELDRLGCHEPAATISGRGASLYSRTGTPEIDHAIVHLREILGDEAYQSLASAGAKMTTAAMVAYAFDQIGRARAQQLREEKYR